MPHRALVTKTGRLKLSVERDKQKNGLCVYDFRMDEDDQSVRKEEKDKRGPPVVRSYRLALMTLMSG